MTRAIAVALVLFLAGGARAADEEARLASLHNATVREDVRAAADDRVVVVICGQVKGVAGQGIARWHDYSNQRRQGTYSYLRFPSSLTVDGDP